MFRFKRKQELERLKNEVVAFVNSTYVEPPKKPTTIRYSMKSKLPGEAQSPDKQPVAPKQPPANPEQHTQAPAKQPERPEQIPEETPALAVQYSRRDNYSKDSVTMLMEDFSSSEDAASLLHGLEESTNSTFTDCLIEHINRKQLRDSTVYKAAQLDRRLFSKIMSDRKYKPSKDTVLAIVFALHLSLPEAEDMLSRAGYVLSHSSHRDVILEYFIRERVYDLTDINIVLDKLWQSKIGR